MAGQQRYVDPRTRELAQKSSNVVTLLNVDPKDDIAAERRKASFSSNQLAVYFNGGEEMFSRRKELAKYLATTEWGKKDKRYFYNREEEYVNGLKTAMGIWDDILSGRYTFEDGKMMRILANFPGGLELHIGMFIPALLSQADEAQQRKWLPLANSLQIIGTYAQTELGHGTFVRGLETTATFDQQTQEFVIHSPTLTSTKWWPGGLGKTATHVILMARLFVGGKDYGPHAFVVQIRGMDNHLPLPGIEVGDIGPKFGFNGVDNGFLSFDHFRIPRENMMMKFSKVTPKGKYIPPPTENAKASYATMVYVRATIVGDAGYILSKAVTIAVRYASVRRQTAARPGQRELQVLDYQNTAGELLPLLAAAYALRFMGQAGMAAYAKFEQDRKRGDFATLPELHAMLAGMKAESSWITSDGIETARRCCGGHGYMLLSGIPTLFTNYVQNVTWEGDNNVLCLQTARYLVKNMEAVAGGKPVTGPSVAYLQDVLRLGGSERSPVGGAKCWMDLGNQVAALRHRAARLVAGAASALREAGGGRLVYEGEPWNGSAIELIRCARAHSMLVLVSTYQDTLAQLTAQGELDAATLAVVGRLGAVFGVSAIVAASGDLLEDGYCNGAQAAAARAAKAALLSALRPDAVALVDSFGFTDYELNSCLGREDGDVYRSLLETSKASPLNATLEGPAWKDVLAPRIQRPHSRL